MALNVPTGSKGLSLPDSKDFLAGLPDQAPEERSPLRDSFAQAAQVDPDKAATARNLSRSLGVAPSRVYSNPDIMALGRRPLPDFAKLATEAPVTAMHFSDPAKMALAQDDLPNLQAQEQAMARASGQDGYQTAWGPAMETFLQRPAEGPLDDLLQYTTAGVIDKSLESAYQYIKSGAANVLSNVLAKGMEWITGDDGYAAIANDIDKAIARQPETKVLQKSIWEAELGEVPEIAAAKTFQAIGSSAPFLVMGLTVEGGAGLLGASAALSEVFGLSLMATMDSVGQAGDAYHELVAQGTDPAEAAREANYVFMMNLPASVLADKLAYFNRFGGPLAKTFVAGGIEGTQEVYQDAIQAGVLGRDMTVGQALETLLFTGLGTAPMGGASSISHTPTQDVGVMPSSPRQVLEEVNNIAAGSKLAERDPEQLVSFWQALHQKMGLPERTFIPANELAKQIRENPEMTPEAGVALLQALGIEANTFEDAIATDNSVGFDSARALHLMRSPIGPTALSMLTYSPESDAAAARAAEEFQGVAEVAQQEIDRQAEAQALQDAILPIRQQMVDAGATSEAADAGSILFSRFVEMGAGYAGMSPAEYLNSLQVEVRPGESAGEGVSGQTQPAEKLFQAAVPPGPRGAFFTEGGKNVIELFKGADESTLVHEMSHLFRRQVEALANMPEAAEQVQADWQTIRTWVGAKEGKDLTPAQEEKWAAGFETYLMEGKAPAPELTSVFERMKDWLLSVYKSVKALGVDLNDDIRGVFDRLLLSEEEIVSASAKADLGPLLQGEDASAEYLDLVTQAQEAARRNVKAARIGEWRRLKKDWRTEAEALWNENAGQALVSQVVEQGGLNYDALKDSLGLDTIKAMRGKTRGLIRNKEGLSLETMAERLGMEPEELATTLADQPSKNAFIQSHIAERQAAWDATQDPLDLVISDELDRLLEYEAQRIVGQATVGRPFGTRSVKAIVREATGQSRIQAAAEEYRGLKDQMRITRAAAREAYAAGKRDEAARLISKYREQAARYKASVDARRTMVRAGAYFRRVLKAPGIAWDYREQIKGLLENVDPNFRSAKTLRRREGLRAFVDRMREQNEIINIPDYVIDKANQKSLGEMTVDEVKDLVDSVKRLEHLGRLKKKLIANKKFRDYEAAVTALVNHIKEKNKQGKLASFAEITRRTKMKSLTDLGDNFRWSLIKPAFIFRMLDGNFTGLATETLMDPVDVATNAEITSQNATIALIKKAFESVPANVRQDWYTAKHRIPGIPDLLTREQILMVGMNWGNAGNRRALTGFYKNARAKWEAGSLENILAEITDQEWDMIQNIWDAIETLWPAFNAMNVQMEGVPLEKVEADPFTTPSGKQIRGGYFPIVLDHRLETRSEKISAEAKAKQAIQDTYASVYARFSTRASAAHQRRGTQLPPLLSFNVIYDHIREVIHDTTHRPAVRDLQKIFDDARFRDAIERSMGLGAYRQLMPWVNEIAHPFRHPYDPVDKVLNYARRGTVIAQLGLNAGIIMLQPTAITNTLDEIGIKDTVRGLVAFFKNPRAANAMIEALSPQIKNRSNTFDRDKRDMLGMVDKMDNRMKTAIEWAYAGMAFTDGMTARASWLGCYIKKFNETQNEVEAIRYADRLIDPTQGSGQPKSLSAIQRGGEFKRLLTMYYSFFSVGMNRLAAAHYDLSQGRENAAINAVRAHWYVAIMPALLGYIFRNWRMPEDEEWLKEVAGFYFSFVPILRDLGSYALGGYDYTMSPVEKSVTNVGRALKYDYKAVSDAFTDEERKPEWWKNLVKRNIEAVGPVLHLPTMQIGRTIDGVWKLMDEDNEDANILDLFVRRPPRSKEE